MELNQFGLYMFEGTIVLHTSESFEIQKMLEERHPDFKALSLQEQAAAVIRVLEVQQLLNAEILLGSTDTMALMFVGDETITFGGFDDKNKIILIPGHMDTALKNAGLLYAFLGEKYPGFKNLIPMHQSLACRNVELLVKAGKQQREMVSQGISLATEILVGLDEQHGHPISLTLSKGVTTTGLDFLPEKYILAGTVLT